MLVTTKRPDANRESARRSDLDRARVREIGRGIFELAEAAQPRFWQQAWWLEAATRLLDHDDRLRTRAFQFVDCLPSLRNHIQLTRHLAEYFDPASVELPKIAHALLGPGPLGEVRTAIIGNVARFGAIQMAGRFITGY